MKRSQTDTLAAILLPHITCLDVPERCLCRKGRMEPGRKLGLQGSGREQRENEDEEEMACRAKQQRRRRRKRRRRSWGQGQWLAGGGGGCSINTGAARLPGHQLLPLPISARQFFPKRRCWYARINLYTYSIQCSFSLVVTIP